MDTRIEEAAGWNDNLVCKIPRQVEVTHGDPEALWLENEEISRQLAAARDQLKQELIQALGGEQ